MKNKCCGCGKGGDQKRDTVRVLKDSRKTVVSYHEDFWEKIERD